MISTSNGVLARMDDPYLGLPYRYCYVGNRDPALPFDQLRGGMPGPSADFAPDAPPTAPIAMLPVVYEIPDPYANPVTGRAQLALPAADASPPGMSPAVAAKLREIGAKIDGANTTPLYTPLHAALKHDGVEVRKDLAYGPHARHRADVYLPKSRATDLRPLVVFAHGGGFTRGAKSADGLFYYDNVGYWAAEHGLVGVTINYRLAPEFKFPSGAEDVERFVAFASAHAEEWRADPARIFLWGHSAGGAHVADCLVRTPKTPVAGVILSSGIYELGDTVSIWKDYYGEDVSLYPQRSSLTKLINVPLPMLVNYAELDAPNFVPDSEKLIAGRKAAGKPLVSLRLPNHSHVSETYAIGTADESLSGPVLKFIEATTK